MMRALGLRMTNDFFAKLFTGAAVLGICGVMYAGLQRWHLGAPFVQAECPVSALLAFDVRWTPVYLSMFALVGVAWLALPNRRAVRRFAVTILAMESVAWVFFFAMPMECPRPVAPADVFWIYRVMIGFDAPVNCFPCLHSALVALAGGAIWREVGAGGWRVAAAARGVVVAWGAAILVSILILRQHTAVDVGAGIALGAAACVFIWRGSGGRGRGGGRWRSGR